jgi:hypothetical protein
MHRRVFQTGLMKIVTNMFDVKPAVKAWKPLPRRHILIQKQLEFIKLFWYAQCCDPTLTAASTFEPVR